MPLEWKALFEAMAADYENNRPGWQPTTEAQFHAMLGAVPPRAYGHLSFLCGEPWNHNDEGHPVYSAFRRVKGGGFEARYMTFDQFMDL